MSYRLPFGFGSGGGSTANEVARSGASVVSTVTTGATSGLATGTTSGRVLTSAAVLFALLVLGVGIRRAGPRLRRRVDPLLAAGIQTLVLLALTGTATLALLVTWNAVGVRAALSGGPQVGIRVTVTLALVIAAALIARFLTRAIDRVAAERREAVHGREIATYLTRAGAFAVAGLLTFSVWGIDLGNLLLGAGLLGAVIGLAARQTIGSVIWGFVILASRPFTVGDWVVVGEREGRVSDITTTSTELVAETGDQVVIANHRIADLDIENRSAAGRLRVDSEVTIERSADLDRAIAVAESALGDVTGTLDSPEPVAAVTAVGENASTLRLSVWIRDPTPERAASIRSEAIVTVMEAARDSGIGGTVETDDGAPSTSNGRDDGERGRHR